MLPDGDGTNIPSWIPPINMMKAVSFNSPMGFHVKAGLGIAKLLYS